MTYADLPAGATVFLDASVFIHHFEPDAAFGPAAIELKDSIRHFNFCYNWFSNHSYLWRTKRWPLQSKPSTKTAC